MKMDRDYATKEEEEVEETNAGSSAFLSLVDDDPFSVATLDFTQDPVEEMTYGRRFAMWLHPEKFVKKEDDNSPSLAKAWGFFEHVTLERHYCDKLEEENDDDEEEDGEGNKTAPTTSNKKYSAIYDQMFTCTCLPFMTKYVGPIRQWWVQHVRVGSRRTFYIAEPGERYQKTSLYPIFGTPLRQLGDFSMGVGIYFTTLLNLAIVLLIGGAYSTQIQIFYASDDYDGTSQDGVPFLLQAGSAICTNRTWVPCPSCDETDFEQGSSHKLTRFYTHYKAVPELQLSGRGRFLNVTNFLKWTSLRPHKLPQVQETGVLHSTDDASARKKQQDYQEHLVQINDLLDVTIPRKHGNITLSRTEGFLLDGTNVTEELGYTPLSCGYLGPSDCYLELHNPNWDHTPQHHYERQGLVGDTNINYIPLHFAEKTGCNGATNALGSCQATVLGYILYWIYNMFFRTKKAEKRFDENEQTAQDYSIVVRNPPPDALEPEEWKAFFEEAMEQDVDIAMRKNNKVTVCTVNVSNDEVITKLLVKRREILKQLELTLPPKTPLDDVEMLSNLSEDCDNPKKVAKLVDNLKTVEGKIHNFFHAADQPVATRVYLTFETESAQRHVLSKMCVGKSQQELIPSHYLFRGTHRLSIAEADEPSTIRWQEQNITRMEMMIRKVITTLITFGLIAGSFFAIQQLYGANSPEGAAIATTIFTFLFPKIADALMMIERHRSETSRQKWLFFKIVTFEVLITTVLPSLTFPFQATLDKDSLIPDIHSLFISQLAMTPLLQYLDIWGNVKRHIMAPRAKTQAEMNACMKGTQMDLAELYANMIKFFFMSLWFSAIYPLGLFMGSLALFVTYFADRFSLMRTWSRIPQVGSEIGHITWKWILPLAIGAMAYISAYYWSGFPFDNLCLDDTVTSLPSYYTGVFDIQETGKDFYIPGLAKVEAQHVDFEIAVSSETPAYKFCNQDLRFHKFLPLSSNQTEWMTPEQADLCNWFPWYAFACLLVVLLYLAGSMAYRAYQEFWGAYTPRGDDQHINYSDVPVIDGYIPQVSSPKFLFPLILCDVQGIDRSAFKWEDQDHPHSYYDVTRDVAKILGKNNYPRVFTQVKHWNPVTSRASTMKKTAKDVLDDLDDSRDYDMDVLCQLEDHSISV